MYSPKRISKRGALLGPNNYMEFLKHFTEKLTLKEAGEVQKCPVGFQLAAISHKIMLWSQKFLTLSIYILSRW